MTEFLCDSRYLVFPASHHAKNKRLCFYEDGKLVYDLSVPLDYVTPDDKFYLDMKPFAGKRLAVSCDQEMEIRIVKSEESVSGDQAYAGKYRPWAHFTARRGWLNDPNGLMYSDGKYRMFYQHNPVSCQWGNMHWGYAESEDLIHWKEGGMVLYPDEMGTMFSGCGVIDERNVTGLQKNGQPVLLLFYTAAGGTSVLSQNQPFTQCLAYSTDGGKTFVKYEKNPLIREIAPGNRDPKVIYYEPTDSYIMALYLSGHDFALFTSKNLLEWTELQRFELEGDDECPDFYPLCVDGDPENVKWVFIAASDYHCIGSFDGKTFTPESRVWHLNLGNGSYAAQSWFNDPKGRRIRTSFISQDVAGMPFGSCMNIPQEMSLKTVGGDIRLCAWPAEEIRKLYRKEEKRERITLEKGEAFRMPMDGRSCDITIQFSEKDSLTTELFGLSIRYDAQRKTLSCMEKTAPIQGKDGVIELRMIFDTLYTELYADSGSVFMGISYMGDANLRVLTLKSETGAQIQSLHTASLGKFWED